LIDLVVKRLDANSKRAKRSSMRRVVFSLGTRASIVAQQGRWLRRTKISTQASAAHAHAHLLLLLFLPRITCIAVPHFLLVHVFFLWRRRSWLQILMFVLLRRLLIHLFALRGTITRVGSIGYIIVLRG
jgi:hypothetical protein